MTIRRNVILLAARAVELELAAMKRNGGLRSINRAYRDQRQAREGCGRRAQSYGAWFANYKVALVRTAAQAAVMTGRPIVSASNQGQSDQWVVSLVAPHLSYAFRVVK
jgi:hypothetical protein